MGIIIIMNDLTEENSENVSVKNDLFSAFVRTSVEAYRDLGAVDPVDFFGPWTISLNNPLITASGSIRLLKALALFVSSSRN